MSKNVENYDLIQMMRRDLLATYRKVAPECMTQAEAWIKTARHPSPRYYVTIETAMRIVPFVVRGQTEILEKFSDNKRRRYMALSEEVKRLAQMPDYRGYTLRQLVRRAILSPAPEFFMTAKNVQHIFISTRKARYDDDGKYTYTKKGKQ